MGRWKEGTNAMVGLLDFWLSPPSVPMTVFDDAHYLVLYTLC